MPSQEGRQVEYGNGRYAVYADREVTLRYYGGAGYVVRHEMYPHTRFTPGGPVTAQGHSMLVGVRQGTGDAGGFTCRRWVLPDTPPAYVA